MVVVGGANHGNMSVFAIAVIIFWTGFLNLG
ncbi:MAG: hypothetical protein AVDCRST_MAG96-1021, partial [uncultured Segetibacter sp.]